MKALRIILVLIYVVLIALLLILKGCQKEEPKPQKAMIQVVDADSRELIEGARVKVKTKAARRYRSPPTKTASARSTIPTRKPRWRPGPPSEAMSLRRWRMSS